MVDFKDQQTQLSRDRWLELAINALSDQGKSKFSLDALIKAMPVSKGSFYWHFKNRADFLLALIEHWDRHETQNVIDALDALPARVSPQDKLWELMRVVYETQSTRHDLLIRSLTLEFPAIYDAVKTVDQKRMKTVQAIFASMGFTGDELVMRTLTFVTTTSFDRQIFSGLSGEEYERQLTLRHRFFISK